MHHSPFPYRFKPATAVKVSELRFCCSAKLVDRHSLNLDADGPCEGMREDALLLRCTSVCLTRQPRRICFADFEKRKLPDTSEKHSREALASPLKAPVGVKLVTFDIARRGEAGRLDGFALCVSTARDCHPASTLFRVIFANVVDA